MEFRWNKPEGCLPLLHFDDNVCLTGAACMTVSRGRLVNDASAVRLEEGDRSGVDIEMTRTTEAAGPRKLLKNTGGTLMNDWKWGTAVQIAAQFIDEDDAEGIYEKVGQILALKRRPESAKAADRKSTQSRKSFGPKAIHKSLVKPSALPK
jgi:hypothetical protein